MTLIDIIQILIEVFLITLGLYFLIGLIFGLIVFSTGGSKIDPLLKENSWKLRLLILPGLMAIWPFLIAKLFKPQPHE